MFAFACVAVMSALGKAANDVSTGILVFFQNFISLVLFAPWALRKGSSELRTSRIWLHILRAAARASRSYWLPWLWRPVISPLKRRQWPIPWTLCETSDLHARRQYRPEGLPIRKPVDTVQQGIDP